LTIKEVVQEVSKRTGEEEVRETSEVFWEKKRTEEENKINIANEYLMSLSCSQKNAISP